MGYDIGETVYYVGASSKYMNKPGILKGRTSMGMRVSYDDGAMVVFPTISLVLNKVDYFKHLLDK